MRSLRVKGFTERGSGTIVMERKRYHIPNFYTGLVCNGVKRSNYGPIKTMDHTPQDLIINSLF